VNAPLDRAILTVRGLDTEAARVKVLNALGAVPGVVGVEGHGSDGALVTYDGGEVTVMDLIRALRKLGFLAGMG
jgi:copper chaperone